MGAVLTRVVAVAGGVASSPLLLQFVKSSKRQPSARERLFAYLCIKCSSGMVDVFVVAVLRV